MDVDVATEIVISRPVEAVSGFAADPDNVPRWYANIKPVEWKTPRPLAAGSQIGFVAKFLGRQHTDEVAEPAPFMAGAMRRANKKDPARLKQILEQGV